jgi:hypothetical protein
MNLMHALTQTLISLSGDQNVLVIRRPFVEFTGSLEAAIMLNQLLYWSDKTKTGWIAKGDQEFAEELCLTIYGVRKGKEALQRMGFLETKIKKFNGTPTTHYRLDLQHLTENWTLWIQKVDSAKSQSPLSENDESITETTTEIIPEITNNDSADASSSPAGDDDPLEPTGEAELLLFSKINEQRRQKGWRSVKKWPNGAVKVKFSAAAPRLDGHLEDAIQCAFTNACTIAVNRVVNYVAKWTPPKGDRVPHRGGGKVLPMYESIAACQAVIEECKGEGGIQG